MTEAGHTKAAGVGFEPVAAVVGEYAPVSRDDVGPETRLREDLGFDSITIIEMAFALERRFALEPVTDDDAMEVETVGDVARLVAELAGGSREAG